MLSSVLVVAACLTFASMGGGDKTSKKTSAKSDFTPIRTTNGFTLKVGPSYRGSIIFKEEKNKAQLSFTSVVTYQKGNTTYILPYKYQVNTQACNNKLQTLNLKINLHK